MASIHVDQTPSRTAMSTKILAIGILGEDLPIEEFSLLQVTCPAAGVTVARYSFPDVIIVDVTIAGAWVAVRTLGALLGDQRPPLVLLVPTLEASAYRHAAWLGVSSVVHTDRPGAISATIARVLASSALTAANDERGAAACL
jgi:hypothetical protein